MDVLQISSASGAPLAEVNRLGVGSYDLLRAWLTLTL